MSYAALDSDSKLSGHPMDDITADLRRYMKIISDNRRLHYVGNQRLFVAVMDYLAAHEHYAFEYQNQLKGGMSAIERTMDILTVVLFWSRALVLELGDAIRQARRQSQPASSPKVSLPDDGAWDRLKSDVLGMRKFILLSDFVGGLVSLLCLVKYNKESSVTDGLIGGYLGMASLAIDVILTSLKYWALCNQYHQKMDFIQAQEKDIDEEIAVINDQLQNFRRQRRERYEAACLNLEQQRLCLVKAKQQLGETRRQLTFDWTYQQYKCRAELAYNVMLMVAFLLLMTCFSSGMAIGMAVAGAALWSGIILVWGAVNAAIDHAKITALHEQRLTDANALLKTFALSTDEQERRGLYLQIKALLARCEHDKGSARYLTIKSVALTLMHASVPVVIFCSLVFFPLTWGIAMMAAFIAFLIAARWQIHHCAQQVEPKRHGFFPSFEREVGKQYDKQFLRLNDKPDLSLVDFQASIAAEAAVATTEPDDGCASWSPHRRAWGI